MDYQDIIALFQQDRAKGLAALFKTYGQQLYGYGVTHFHISEDESYDTLYKTLETVGQVIDRYAFSSANHFDNWLFKIHKNNILQLLRAKKSKEAVPGVLEYKDWEDEVKALEEGSFELQEFKSVIDKLAGLNPYGSSPNHSQLMSALQKAMQQITDLERDLLLLRMNEYSYDEIANMLGIENNQLKVKFNRAKGKVEKKTLEILKDYYNETK